MVYRRRMSVLSGLGVVSKRIKLIDEKTNYPGDSIQKVFEYARAEWGERIDWEQGVMIIFTDTNGYLDKTIYRKINDLSEIESLIKPFRGKKKLIIIRNLIRGTHYPGRKEEEMIRRIAKANNLYDYLIINKQYYFSAKAQGMTN